MLHPLTQYDVSFHSLPSEGYLNNLETPKGKGNHKKMYVQIMLIDCSKVEKNNDNKKIKNNQKLICGWWDDLRELTKPRCGKWYIRTEIFQMFV